MSPDDICQTCGHRRELHDEGGCRYVHAHSGRCGSYGGTPPYGAGNVTRCKAFVASLLERVQP